MNRFDSEKGWYNKISISGIADGINFSRNDRSS